MSSRAHIKVIGWQQQAPAGVLHGVDSLELFARDCAHGTPLLTFPRPHNCVWRAHTGSSAITMSGYKKRDHEQTHPTMRALSRLSPHATHSDTTTTVLLKLRKRNWENKENQRMELQRGRQTFGAHDPHELVCLSPVGLVSRVDGRFVVPFGELRVLQVRAGVHAGRISEVVGLEEDAL